MKIITNFDIDLSDMSADKQQRRFVVSADDGAVFSLEIKNEDGHYYNFSTESFAAAKSRLKTRRVTGGIYVGFITFPAISDNDQYDIYLFAEHHADTFHAEHTEVRFADGSLDLNSSKGSNSSLLQKVIYQYTDTTITLSAISPNSLAGFTSVVVTTDTIVVPRGRKRSPIPFSIVVTAATTKALMINKQPTINDIAAYASRTMGDGVEIKGENIWSGAARDTDTVDGAVSSAAKIVMDTNVADKMAVGDRVTGGDIASTAVVTVVALNPDGDNVKEFSVSENVDCDDGVTLTFKPPYYYRWSIDESSIHGLLPGMALITGNATSGSLIQDYESTTTYTTEIPDGEFGVKEVTNTVVDVAVPAVDPLGYKPTITNGVVSGQFGNITFNKQQTNDLADDSVKFYAYGPNAIQSLHNSEIKLHNLKVELTKPTTTTTSAVDNSATIPVADREGTIQNVSTISGIGISSSTANPTISSTTADGAGSWTASAAQTLENGITLTVENTSRVATITGELEVVSVNDSDFTLRFDLERIITAA